MDSQDDQRESPKTMIEIAVDAYRDAVKARVLAQAATPPGYPWSDDFIQAYYTEREARKLLIRLASGEQ